MTKQFGIDFPVTIIDGAIKESSLNSSIESDIKIALYWPIYNRVFLNNFGSSLEQFIGKPNDNLTKVEIRQEINRVISTYETKVSIISINITDEEDSLNIILQLKVNDTQEILLITI